MYQISSVNGGRSVCWRVPLLQIFEQVEQQVRVTVLSFLLPLFYVLNKYLLYGKLSILYKISTRETPCNLSSHQHNILYDPIL